MGQDRLRALRPEVFLWSSKPVSGSFRAADGFIHKPEGHVMATSGWGDSA